MNNNKNELTELEFRSLVQKTEVPAVSPGLSNIIMERVYGIEQQRAAYLKYINYSWLFIVVALILSLFALSSFSYIQAAFASYLNQLLPGLYDYFTLLLITIIASLFLYQLNQLLSYRYRKVDLAT